MSIAAIRAGWSAVQLEVEHVDVLAHALGANGFGDDDDVALDEPAQDDLGDGLAVRRADLAEDGVGEDVVLAFGERAQDSIWTPCSRMTAWSAVRWLNGCVSIWSTAGVTSLWARRSASRSG